MKIVCQGVFSQLPEPHLSERKLEHYASNAKFPTWSLAVTPKWTHKIELLSLGMKKKKLSYLKRAPILSSIVANTIWQFIFILLYWRTWKNKQKMTEDHIISN